MSSDRPADGTAPGAQALDDPRRVAALLASALLDSPPDDAFDRATRLASAVLDAPVSLVSIVATDRQFFVSQIGLPEPWASRRETPLTHSFCQHVVTSGQLFEVEDATVDPRVAGSLAIEGLRAIAYLGVPISDPDGNTLGAFCVIDHQGRKWTDRERSLLGDLAAQVNDVLRGRATVAALQDARRANDNLQSLVTHDLKGLVATIAGAADVLAESALGRDGDFVRIIERQADRMDRLVSGLAAVRRTSEPRQPRSVDVARAVRAAISRRVDAHRVHIEAPRPVHVRTDGDGLTQIARNLVDNALRHGDEGAPVTVEVTPWRPPGVTDDPAADDPGVQLAFTNSGTPIDPARLAGLFGRGSDGDAHPRPGLGLHIVRSVTAALGGRIDAASDAEATRVTVQIPSQRSNPPSPRR